MEVNNSENQRCTIWEEEMYWKHFNSMHFCHILPIDFYHHLVLPLKFTENMITELPDKVSLLGPSGTMWEVALMKTNRIAFEGDGWKEFVKAYNLEVGYLLVFKYKRNVGFEVLIFDPVSLCEKEAAYFVKKHEYRNSIPPPESDKKRSSTEAFGTEIFEDEENSDNDSEFLVSKRVRKDAEEPVSVRGRNLPTPQKCSPRKCSTIRGTRGGKRATRGGKRATRGGKRATRGGRGGRGGSRKLVLLKSATNLEAKSSGEKPKGNQAAKEQGLLEMGGSTTEMGHSHESSEIRGNKPDENEGAEEQKSPETTGNTLEKVQPQKCNEKSGKKPNGNQGSEEQQNISETTGNTFEKVQLQKCNETRGKKPNGDQGAEEQNSPETTRDTLEKVQLQKFNETRGNKPNGDEPTKEQNRPENGGSIPKTVNPLKCYESRGKKPTGDGAAKKQHITEIGGSILETVHLDKSNETRGNKPIGNEASKEQNSPEIGRTTIETVLPIKLSRSRGRPKKQGKKPNKNEAAKELISPETGGSTLETVHSQKSSETGGQPKQKIAPNSSKVGSPRKRNYVEHVSNRRPVTELEKKKALQRASKEITKRSFIGVMRPTTVYKRFYLNIPAEWVYQHLPNRHQEAFLRIGEKTWQTMFYCYNQKGGGIAGAGWKKFAIDNKLEEFDACLFKLTSQMGDPAIIFDVEIFRVIPVMVSPSLVVPPKLA